MVEISAAQNLHARPVSSMGLVLVSIIWLVAIAAAAGVALWQNTVPQQDILWVAGIAAAPAIFGLLLTPMMAREWAQISVIFAWIALAILASFAIAFVPMAILFLCAPAASALFAREKVIEAMVLSAIAAGLVYYAHRYGFGSRLDVPTSISDWGQATAPAATIVFMIGAMFAAANARTTDGLNGVSASYASVDAIESYPGAAFLLDDEGDIKIASNRAHQYLATTPGTAKGLTLANILTNSEVADERISYAIDEVQMSGESQSLDVTARFMDADVEVPQAVRLDITPARDQGVYVYVRDVTEDITDNTPEIEALRLAQKEAEREAEDKSLFFAGVSHELRTPLNAIIGFSDMMRSRLFGPLPGKYADYADMIHESGQHMLDLIGDVLDVSKLDAGKYELVYDSFDVADVVRSSVKMLRPSADAAEITLDVEIASDEPLMLDADRRAVRQILLNLLSNAVKFTSKGGRIITSAQLMGETLSLTVEDNGAGMSEDELVRIGEPYAQGASAAMSQARGSGLGLSLVKSMAELHGGTLAVASDVGVGTTVTVSLPQTKKESYN